MKTEETLYEKAQAIKENRDFFAKTIKEIIQTFREKAPNIRHEIPMKVQNDILNQTELRSYQVEYGNAQVFQTDQFELTDLDKLTKFDDLSEICQFLFYKKHDKRCHNYPTLDNPYYFDYDVYYSDDGHFYSETDRYRLQCKTNNHNEYQLFISTYVSIDNITKLLASQGFTIDNLGDSYRITW